ncbi:hypothetical protein SUGI_1196440 [Cryptomeria japonica]|nr:hypothetical protein SUGI_1196440 [Cryptomeria japonica]
MEIPGIAIGLIIGKGGTNLKNFHQIPGISSVKCNPKGTLQINADSHEALETVAATIEELVSFALSKNSGYYPEYFAFCFCKSVQNPKLAVNRVSFERFHSDISNLREEDRDTPFFALKCAQHCENNLNEMDDLAAGFAELGSQLFFNSNWDLSAYRSNLQSSLEPVIFSHYETMRSVKLVVRFGKLLFHGANWSELQQGDFMPVRHLQDLCRGKRLKQRFSTACPESSLKDDALFLDLQTLGYQKVSSQKKISIQVADLKNRKLQFNVSVCFRSSDGLEGETAITRVGNQRKRHAFVAFCREGSCKADFRLGLISHGAMDADAEMVQWIEKASKNRTPDGLLVFDPPGRFLVMNIRYIDAHTYVTEDWKFRVARIRDGDRSNKFCNRWDCRLSSRWFKANLDQIEEENMDSVMNNVEALVKEAAKLSPLMDAT